MNILHFVNTNTLDTGVSSDIIDMPFTDHRDVLMNIVSEYIKHGSGYWKLNDSLLKDYVNGVNKSALMAQWLRDHATEPKGHEFEPHECHLVRAYGHRYVQVRPVRPKISHSKRKVFLE